ncbi:MAG: hypothetical protein ABI600_04805 [Luteolibacter sp.]
MKEILYLLSILAVGALGYKYEPDLRFRLTGVQPESEIIHETVVVEVPAQTAQDPTPKIDLASLTTSQLPEKVLLNVEAKVADSASGVVMTIDAGNRVKLVRIENDSLIISPGEGPFVGKVAISDTDLMVQLAAKPPSPVAPAPETPVAAPPTQEPVAPVTGDSQEPAPAPAPDPTPAPAPEPSPAPEVAPMPEPAPASPPEATPAPLAGSTDVVKAMQESVRAAQIKEFTFTQVLDWKAGSDESVDGETYQTGLASYKAETIFGVKTIQAKALLKGGKVQRWIWPKSGMEIK